jgi:predicted RNA-binding protein with TRAM domain
MNHEGSEKESGRGICGTGGNEREAGLRPERMSGWKSASSATEAEESIRGSGSAAESTKPNARHAAARVRLRSKEVSKLVGKFDNYDYDERDRMVGLQKGQKLKIKVEGKGSKGDFFGKLKGLVIFIRDCNAVPIGEAIEIEITEVSEKVAFAKRV